MHSRVPITLRTVYAHEGPVPTVATVDLFGVLRPDDALAAARSTTDEHLTLDMARVFATGVDHDEARTLQAYLADAMRRWAETGQV